jgi:hypothetical protein
MLLEYDTMTKEKSLKVGFKETKQELERKEATLKLLEWMSREQRKERK